MQTALLLAACLIIAVTGFSSEKDASSETAAIQYHEETQVKSRILIVPGLLGSQLQLYRSGRMSKLGIGPELIRVLRMVYRPIRKKWTERIGKRVEVLGFGTTNKVECLSKSCKAPYKYFKTFVDFFVEKGYARNVDIRAAPYDWRLSPIELKERGYFDEVKELIEQMRNQGKGVNIVAHSIGGLNMLHFLKTMTPEWKAKYVNSFIPLASPFGGAVNALVAMMYGGKDVKQLKCKEATSILCQILANVARRFPSSFMLLPRPDVFKTKTIVTRKYISWFKKKEQNFTAEDYENLFKTYRAQHLNSWSKYKLVRNINKDLTEAPGVPTYCMYGLTDTPNTPERITLENGFPYSGKANTSYGEGDNVVNKISLEACSKFATKVDMSPGVNHLGIVSNRSVLLKIYNFIRPRK